MAPLISALFACLAVYIVILAAYLLLITMAAAFYRLATPADAQPLRVAILVPAHNEEMQIQETVTTLLASAYPVERRDVFVISDNSSDATAVRAREAGATVFERVDPVNPGKGQAIDWLLTSEAECLRRYDVLAVVDADTAVDADFLEQISNTLQVPGVRVAQGSHGVSNPEANWRTAITTAGFSMINHLRPMGRNALGCSTELNGNGMAFESRLLVERGWTAHSVVEDIEMALQLLLDGVMVRFNPKARVWAEMATSRTQAAPQRRRWEGGRFQIMRMYLPRLLLKFVTTARIRYLDAFLNLLVPPLSLLVLIQLAGVAFALAWLPQWLPLMVLCLGVTALHVFVSLAAVRAPAKVWLYLLAAPLFLLWKLPIYAGLIVRPRQNQWVRTERNAEARAKTKS